MIDSYDISNKIKTKISKKVKVIAIEDTLTQIGGCKVIFPHPITVHKNNNIHTGIKYAAVDTKKKKNRKVFLYKKKLNILINIGFYDSKGYSVLAIKSVIYLMKIINIKINCDIFIVVLVRI